jgi:5-methyltetrahydropteroyltriglutamate--homocysteine methyltransferase
MTGRTRPPFRYDHVGSFLRPKYLLEARDQAKKGAITKAQLREVEDRAIVEIVKTQESWGLKAVTDGEFRRTWFHVDFLEQLEGVEMKGGIPVSFRTPTGTIEQAPPVLHITGKVRHVKPIQLDDYRFLAQATKVMPKVAIPSPTMLHFRGARQGISKDAYPDLDQFYEDVAAAYREELKQLADAGCRYVQLDDTNLAYLCDPKMREAAKGRGLDPDKLPSQYAQFINRAIEGRHKDMVVCIHLCRGNFKSAWAAEGGYEPVAEAMFNELQVDGYFLEYDDARSGDFSPLRFVPKGHKIVVLGLVTSKQAAMETKSLLKSRIEEATKYCALDQLALSPQCGFSSTVDGNAVDEKVTADKMGLVIETAKEVWKDA